jgi:hypothetical protein
LNIQGAKGLLLDTRAIGADWRFVKEELQIAAFPYFDPKSRIDAAVLGVGLGLSALPKTIFKVVTFRNNLVNISHGQPLIFLSD